MILSCEGIPDQTTFRRFSSHRSLSYTKRFLVIGSLLRRLDIFVNGLRRRYVTTEGRITNADFPASQLQNRRPITPQFCACPDNVHREHSTAALEFPGFFPCADTSQHLSPVFEP
jgi:hypothetical protein